MMLLMALVKPLAYISLPFVLLHTVSSISPLSRRYVRLGLYLSAVGACSLWGVIASVGMALLGNRSDTNWIVARSFYYLASRLLGITFEVEGEEYLSIRPAVLVGNHQSMLDLLFLGRIFPTHASITAKKELRWMPLLGQFMSLSGAIFIDRKNRERAIHSMAKAGKMMKEHKLSIWLFPEGTRTLSEKPSIREFKKGAFHLAVQAGVPITPVVCENYYRLYHSGVFEEGKLKIKVLPPVPTTGLTASDINDLSSRIREQMLEALYEMSDGRPEGSQASIQKDLVVEASTPIVSQQVPEAEVDENAPSTTDSESVDLDNMSVPTSTAPSEALDIDTSSPQVRRRNGSERGPETEEDEGMVLVDRPGTPSA